jgi:hypothetical protein
VVSWLILLERQQRRPDLARLAVGPQAG